MINIIRDLPILCNVKWEEHGRNELGINSSEAVGRRKEGMDIVSISLLSGIPHISLDNPCLYDMWNIGSAYKSIIKFVKRQGSKKGRASYVLYLTICCVTPSLSNFCQK